jgi:hypothetical protein
VLAAIEKGATAVEMVEATRRARSAEIATSVMVLVGIAGREGSLEHARRSAEAVNRMEPTYTSLLTYTPTPGSPLHDRVARGELELPTAMGSLAEIREFVGGLRCETYFSCNHASNHLPLRGRIPSAQAEILHWLGEALAGRVRLKPEFLRGL